MSDEYRTRLILFEIEASPDHCSADCPGMGNQADYCTVFNDHLRWDSLKTSNGCCRLNECMVAEARVREKNLTPEQGDGCTRYGCVLAPILKVRWESKLNGGPIYVLCCSEHAVDVLRDHRDDVVGTEFRLEHLNEEG